MCALNWDDFFFYEGEQLKVAQIENPRDRETHNVSPRVLKSPISSEGDGLFTVKRYRF